MQAMEPQMTSGGIPKAEYHLIAMRFRPDLRHGLTWLYQMFKASRSFAAYTHCAVAVKYCGFFTLVDNHNQKKLPTLRRFENEEQLLRHLRLAYPSLVELISVQILKPVRGVRLSTLHCAPYHQIPLVLWTNNTSKTICTTNAAKLLGAGRQITVAEALEIAAIKFVLTKFGGDSDNNYSEDV